jgi:hypothetical protein
LKSQVLAARRGSIHLQAQCLQKAEALHGGIAFISGTIGNMPEHATLN